MAPARRRAQVKALYADVEFEEVPLDGMRATIARRLVEAKQTVPHFYLTADVDDGCAHQTPRGGQLRRAEARTAAAYKLSVNDFVIKALALACSACRPPTRCGPATASCASGIPMSVSRSRSRAGC